ncbi:2Fe-2S iron-sulfur cluster-binding protein [Caldimonas thermodepolymerans]|uniref:3-phenylpropionate/trans-cinnamate dioxygenase ferredoxin reductase subunit n=1 Tax=Caldimonas thermodepolymerans TaxID=215580 RepID=A0AA46HVS8_9BURK|nr:2Fe-2S iron-sulfur cluster-binding protein [Caldimonas thermodepolymerans]TCP07100.1 3-phenylpropionate/trans-cinnamate dioxygenase ferredoxin reductase subunit [Caldimonas thermodepolymerans]UZG46656.1 2Fe-2S iron-sulfur cluster-binding protein [Caldimonas thermodepolymerans]
MLFDTRTRVDVHVVQTGESYPCATDESLLRGMLRLGRRGIPAGCVNGGCGVCKVQIVEGEVRALGPVSRAHVSVEEEARGYTLACRAAPVTAVRLEVCARLAKPFTRAAAPAVSAVPHRPTATTKET